MCILSLVPPLTHFPHYTIHRGGRRTREVVQLSIERGAKCGLFTLIQYGRCLFEGEGWPTFSSQQETSIDQVMYTIVSRDWDFPPLA